MESREVFWHLGTQQLIIFYVIGAASIAVFLYGIYRHIAKYAAGRSLTSPLELKQNRSGFGDIFFAQIAAKA